MQTSTGNTPAKEPLDAAFGVFLFALGTMLLVIIPWVSAASILATILIGFTAGLLIAGGLYLIIKEAVRTSK